MKITLNVICRCGAIIPDDNTYKWNTSNIEGEDYGVVTGTCDNCSSKFETTQWGECENLEETKAVIQHYISEIIK